MDGMTPTTTQQAALAARYGAAAPAAGPWNATIAGMLDHRSVRGYRPDALPAGTLETLVAAAQSAATSSNLQTWSVVSVEDPVGPLDEGGVDGDGDQLVAERPVPHPGVHGVGPPVLAEVQLLAEELPVESHDQRPDVAADVDHHRSALRGQAGLVLVAVLVLAVVLVAVLVVVLVVGVAAGGEVEVLGGGHDGGTTSNPPFGWSR